YAKKVLRADPDESTCLSWIGSKLPPDEAIAILKPGLEKRPVLIEWHRVYQSVMEKAHPEADLKAEYQKLAAEVKSPDCQYLLARVMDGEEGTPVLEQAAKGNPPSAYAQYSLGYRALAQGRFDEAKTMMEKALQTKPGEALFEHFYEDALWASRSYDKLREAPQGKQLFDQLRLAAITNDEVLLESTKKQLVAMMSQVQATPSPSMTVGEGVD